MGPYVLVSHLFALSRSGVANVGPCDSLAGAGSGIDKAWRFSAARGYDTSDCHHDHSMNISLACYPKANPSSNLQTSKARN